MTTCPQSPTIPLSCRAPNKTKAFGQEYTAWAEQCFNRVGFLCNQEKLFHTFKNTILRRGSQAPPDFPSSQLLKKAKNPLSLGKFWGAVLPYWLEEWHELALLSAPPEVKPRSVAFPFLRG